MTATPQERFDATVDVITEVARDCERLGLTPFSLQVQWWESGPATVYVQMSGHDTASVDALADAYSFDPDRPSDGPAAGNYRRVGRLGIAGHIVSLTVFTGRPEQEADQ